jgi:release factor glutamine methyltransferase
MTEAFTKTGLDSPRLCAEILLGHVLDLDRLKLYIGADREPEPDQLQRLRALVARALKHEPVQYLTGEAWFFGLPFRVSPAVLVPRPCTELIVERVMAEARQARAPIADSPPAAAEAGSESPPTQVLVGDELRAKNKAAAARAGEGLLIADICTGSGCIAVAIAKRLPAARLIATDISPGALAVAAKNAERHEVESRIDFREGDLLAPLLDQPPLADVLVSNPPYIPDHEWDTVPANVRLFEPSLALRGGPDGLALVKPLIEDATRVLKPGGLLLVEIAAVTAPQVERLAAQAGLQDVRVLPDWEGLPRVLHARTPESR